MATANARAAAATAAAADLLNTYFLLLLLLLLLKRLRDSEPRLPVIVFSGSLSPSAANAFGGGEGNDSYANGKPSATAASSAEKDSLVGLDEETRRVLVKAGLGRMPATTSEWVKFERVQQGKSNAHSD